MPRHILLPLILLLFLLQGTQAFSANYEIKKVSDNAYAALVTSGGKATSNALFIVTEGGVLLAGAHFTADGIKELQAEIAKVTALPLRYAILTHHHRGYNYLDFDFPPEVEMIASWQTWQALKAETRPLKNPLLYFDNSISLLRGKLTIILSNMERGQADGDLIVYLPDQGVLFTSDLVYNGVVGYMGEGYMRDWVLDLEMLLEIESRTVVPGLGGVADREGINRFRLFMKDFITEVLRHVEKGESLAQTKRGFTLPQYEKLPGYRENFDANVERAYKQVKEGLD